MDLTPIYSIDVAAGVKGVGDLDGDGFGEIVAGCHIYSGPDGEFLATLPGIAGQIAGGRDLDRDGVPDLVVGSAADATVRVYSGADLSVVGTLEGASFDRFGFAVAVLPDMSGDGIAEIAVGDPEDGLGAAFLFTLDDDPNPGRLQATELRASLALRRWEDCAG